MEQATKARQSGTPWETIMLPTAWVLRNKQCTSAVAGCRIPFCHFAMFMHASLLHARLPMSTTLQPPHSPHGLSNNVGSRPGHTPWSPNWLGCLKMVAQPAALAAAHTAGPEHTT